VRDRGVPGRPGLTATDVLRRARILEVDEVRRAVEVEAARLAATRVRPADLDVLSGLLRQELVGGDTGGFVDADLEFHHAVIAAAGNDLLGTLCDQLHEPLRQTITALAEDEPELPDTGEDHAALLDAIRDADPDRAAEVTVRHFDAIIDLRRPTRSAPAGDGGGRVPRRRCLISS